MNYVLDIDKCTGCMACYNICQFDAINIVMDASGCKYPAIDNDKCVKCQECHRVCNNRKAVTYPRQSAYFCYGSHDDMRVESTSGGLFSELAAHTIANNGTVFGVAWDDNNQAVYCCARTLDELAPLRKSKYVHSDVNLSYRQAESELQQGRMVLFSGTPCIIAGLRAYLGREYDNLLCIDIICHGIPGQGIWSDYVHFLKEKHNSAITDFVHRYGEWDERCAYFHYCYTDSDKLSTVNVTTTFDESSYMKGFSNYDILMEACYQCQFRGKEGISDITIGDAWGYSKIMGKNGSPLGESLAVINSAKGKEIFHQLTKSNSIVLTKQIDIDDIKDINARLFVSPKYGVKYNKFKKLYRQGLHQEALNELMVPTREDLYNALNTKWFNSCIEGQTPIQDYFNNNNITNVVIYGTGSLGLQLAKYIVCNNVDTNIAYCIDANPVPFMGMDITMYSSSCIDTIPDKNDIDAIIITPIHAKEPIRKMLTNYYNCPIISLDEILI